MSRYSTHNVVKDLIGKNNLVLDVGCNDGILGKISARSNKFYGIDINKNALKQTKKNYIATLYYDLNDLKPILWNIKFDVIVFADVLEHTLYPEKVLSFFIKKYLKKDGKVVISLPNVANWQVRGSLLFGRFDYQDAGVLDRTHLHLFTFKSAKELVDKCSLKIIKTRYGSSLFGYIIFLFPFLRGLLTSSIVLEAKKVYER